MIARTSFNGPSAQKSTAWNLIGKSLFSVLNMKSDNWPAFLWFSQNIPLSRFFLLALVTFERCGMKCAVWCSFHFFEKIEIVLVMPTRRLSGTLLSLHISHQRDAIEPSRDKPS